MTNAIQQYTESPLDERHRYAQALASAGDLIPRGLFGPPENGNPPAPSPGKVLLVLETGAMLGLHPIAALSGINVIEGKPAASAGLMSAIVRSAGHKLRTTETGTIEGGDYSVTSSLVREDDPDHPFSSTWTPQRAARAGLCRYERDADGVWRVIATSSRGNALPWQLYTESLCKARTVSEVSRDGAQDALFGVRYTPEELGGEIDAYGEYTGQASEPEADPQPEPTAKPAPRKRATNGTQGTRRKAAAEEPVEATVEPEPEQSAAQREEDVQDAEVVEDEPQPDEGVSMVMSTEGGEVAATFSLEEPPTEQSEADAAERHEAEERARIAAEQEARAEAEAAAAATEAKPVTPSQREMDAALKAKRAARDEEAKAATDAVWNATPIPTPEGDTFESLREAWDVAVNQQAVTPELTASLLERLKVTWAAAGPMPSGHRMEFIKLKARMESYATPAES